MSVPERELCRRERDRMLDGLGSTAHGLECNQCRKFADGLNLVDEMLLEAPPASAPDRAAALAIAAVLEEQDRAQRRQTFVAIAGVVATTIAASWYFVEFVSPTALAEVAEPILGVELPDVPGALRDWAATTAAASAAVLEKIGLATTAAVASLWALGASLLIRWTAADL